MERYTALRRKFPELQKISKLTMDECFRHRSSPTKSDGKRDNRILAQVGDSALLLFEQLASEKRFTDARDLHNHTQLYVTNKRLAEIGRKMELEQYIECAYGVFINDVIIATSVEALVGAITRSAFQRGISFWRSIRVLDMPSLDEWEITEQN